MNKVIKNAEIFLLFVMAILISGCSTLMLTEPSPYKNSGFSNCQQKKAAVHISKTFLSNKMDASVVFGCLSSRGWDTVDMSKAGSLSQVFAEARNKNLPYVISVSYYSGGVISSDGTFGAVKCIIYDTATSKMVFRGMGRASDIVSSSYSGAAGYYPGSYQSTRTTVLRNVSAESILDEAIKKAFQDLP